MKEAAVDKTERSGARTLLTSVLLSSPGPLVVGIGLILGRSSTQLADFIRRTAELVAIFVFFLVYRTLHKGGPDPDFIHKRSLERMANLGVGTAMGLSGIAMLCVAIFKQDYPSGNVVPGLCIAILGVTTNSWFWLRYRRLNHEKPDAILAVQSKLYRAKSLVDSCVLIALSTVALAPGSLLARYMDTGGSIVVALYLTISGITIIKKCLAPQDLEE